MGSFPPKSPAPLKNFHEGKIKGQRNSFCKKENIAKSAGVNPRPTQAQNWYTNQAPSGRELAAEQTEGECANSLFCIIHFFHLNLNFHPISRAVPWCRRQIPCIKIGDETPALRKREFCKRRGVEGAAPYILVQKRISITKRIFPKFSFLHN